MDNSTSNSFLNESFDFDKYLNSMKVWYCQKYISPYAAMSRFCILFILLLYGFLTLYDLLRNTSEIIKLPFPIYVSQNIGENYHIKDLSEEKYGIDSGIASYMVRRYVMLREEYTPALLNTDKWKNLLINIDNMSSYYEFSKYIKYMLPYKNFQSPILLYKFNISVIPVIEKIVILPKQEWEPSSAIVYLTNKVCKTDDRCMNHHYKIKMQFKMDSVNQLINLKGNMFRFKVFEYGKSSWDGNLENIKNT